MVYGRKAGLEFLCQLPVCHLVIEFVEAAQICVAPNFASGALATEVQLFDSLQCALVAATTFLLFPVRVTIACIQNVFVSVSCFLQPFARQTALFAAAEFRIQRSLDVLIRVFCRK